MRIRRGRTSRRRTTSRCFLYSHMAMARSKPEGSDSMPVFEVDVVVDSLACYTNNIT